MATIREMEYLRSSINDLGRALLQNRLMEERKRESMAQEAMRRSMLERQRDQDLATEAYRNKMLSIQQGQLDARLKKLSSEEEAQLQKDLATEAYRNKTLGIQQGQLDARLKELSRDEEVKLQKDVDAYGEQFAEMISKGAMTPQHAQNVLSQVPDDRRKFFENSMIWQAIASGGVQKLPDSSRSVGLARDDYIFRVDYDAKTKELQLVNEQIQAIKGSDVELIDKSGDKTRIGAEYERLLMQRNKLEADLESMKAGGAGAGYAPSPTAAPSAPTGLQPPPQKPLTERKLRFDPSTGTLQDIK